MAAFGFAERGWPAGRIPTTREIVLSMIERSAWRYVTDVQAELEAGEWTEYASSVRERGRACPLSEFYCTYGSEPHESKETIPSTTKGRWAARSTTTGPTAGSAPGEHSACRGNPDHIHTHMPCMSAVSR